MLVSMIVHPSVNSVNQANEQKLLKAKKKKRIIGFIWIFFYLTMQVYI